MIRIEGELNELGLLFIKRIVIKIYLDTISEMFLLIVTTMIAIILLYTLPSSSEEFDLFSILFGFVVLLWAVMGVLHVSTFLYSSGKEEGDQLHFKEDEEELERID